MASKIVEAVSDGSFTYRDNIRRYYRSGGKFRLSPKEVDILERCELVQELLLEYRPDMKAAKAAIKKRFELQHREEVDRYIEDATYLLGAGFNMDKGYQRLMQWQDIEWGIKAAKEAKDLLALERFLHRREKLFQLDQADVEQSFDYFSVMNIIPQFRPEDFKHALPPDYMDIVKAIQAKAMRDLGLNTEEAHDVEFT